MPKCQVCSYPQEYLLAINQRLENGESQADIAKEFGFSPDAVQRHSARHIRVRAKAASQPATLADRLEYLWQKSDDLLRQTIATGDVRAAVDTLGKLSAVAESLSRLQRENHAYFGDATSPEARLQWMLGNEDGKAVLRAYLDSLVSAFKPDAKPV